jgi:DNA repair protein RecO (recombination protein O)
MHMVESNRKRFRLSDNERMPTYTVHAINIGGFLLGESDKVLIIFSSERGIIRAVAKGARKPNTKMSGRSDALCINKLFLSTGKSFEIITQAESIEGFPEFRQDLERMSYGLYYAELTNHFGQGLSEESEMYFQFLVKGLELQARSKHDPSWLCLEFEMGMLDILGYRPELTYCVVCRDVLGDYNLGTFNRELGGVVCQKCSFQERQMAVAEGVRSRDSEWRTGAYITPLVWKNLVLSADRRVSEHGADQPGVVKQAAMQQSVDAARRLTQGYIEHRAGKRMKSLEVLEQLNVR